MAQRLVREVGNWVAGDRFFGREHELRDLMELLGEGANVLITGPRRMGKTSLMREVQRQIADHTSSVFLDVQDGATPADLIVELGTESKLDKRLWSRVRGAFAAVLGQVDELAIDTLKLKFADAVAGDWAAKGDRLLNALAAPDTHVVIFIDELPILVNRMLRNEDGNIDPAGRRDADALMSWLRKSAQRHRGSISFVCAGSIGLEPVLRSAGLSATVNGFTPYHVEAWTTPVAQGCLQALALNYGLTLDQDVLDNITERLGLCVPHHVQSYFSHLYEDAKRRGATTCTINDAETVYRTRLLGSYGHAELSHFEERLVRVLGAARTPLALDLLTEAAVVGLLTPTSIAALVAEHAETNAASAAQRDIFDILLHDGYLKQLGDTFAFHSGLLRDWWAKRHSVGFVRAEERSR